jgi:hypothetical protein
MRSSLAFLILLASPAAFAQSAEDRAAADSLFDEGKTLSAAGKWDEACQKFAASEKLVERTGTLLNLADCHERTGKLASAWAEFRQAATLVERENANDQRAAFARDRAAKLEPQLSHLTIALTDAASGIEIKRDGVVVNAALFGSSVAVDPGKHTVAATAPGRAPWSEEVTIDPAKSLTVTIPALAEAQQATGPGPETPGPDPRAKRRKLALIVGASGAGVVVVGAVFGLLASSSWNAAHDGGKCDQNTQCTKEGYDLVKTAQTEATISTIGFGVGLAAVAAGAVLWVTAPHRTAETPSVSVGPLPGGAAAFVVGRF